MPAVLVFTACGTLPLPRTLGWPEACADCKQEPAIIEGRGTDCVTRRQHAEVQSQWPDFPAPFAKDFDELARRAGVGQADRSKALGRRDSTSHLATIAADGNRLGAIFAELNAIAPPLLSFGAMASTHINEASRQAVVAATTAAGDDDAAVAGCVPHYVGGDDIFVSVPAGQAWRFATALAGSFERVRRSLHEELFADPAYRELSVASRKGLSDLVNSVSLGVGVTFAPRTHPLADSGRLAHDALGEAKVSTRGKVSAIAWIDVTEGVSQQSSAPVLRLNRALVELEHTLEQPAVFRRPPSARARLADMARQTPYDATQADGGQRQAWLDAYVKRLGIPERIPGATLEADLSRARWWPTAEHAEGGED